MLISKFEQFYEERQKSDNKEIAKTKKILEKERKRHEEAKMIKAISVACGALANPDSFLRQLAGVGIEAHVETEILDFQVDSFNEAWDVFAGVTTANLPLELQLEAKEAVMTAMWPGGEGPRQFRNETQFIIGGKAG